MNRRVAWIGMMVGGVLVVTWPAGWVPVCADEPKAEKTQQQPQTQSPSQQEAPPSQPSESQAPPSAQDTAKPEQAQTAQSAPSSEQPTGTSEASPAASSTSAQGLAQAEAKPSQAGLISVDFKDAEIRQVLRILSLKSGVDIVASPDVEGLVTIKLTNVPWEQALEIILRTYGFAYERKGNVVRVMTQQSVEQEALSTEVFPLSYAKAKEVSDVIKEMLSDRGKIKFDERTNTLIVTDLPSNLFQLKQVVERLDQATAQVYIESKIIETKVSDTKSLGIDWFDSAQFTVTPAIIPTTFPFPQRDTFGKVGKLFVPKAGSLSDSGSFAGSEGKIPEIGGTFTFGKLAPPTTLSATLNMLKSRQDIRVISNPTIVTLNNREAFVQVGEDINVPNYQIDSTTGKATVSGASTRSIGVLLKVTPHVNPQKQIVLDLKPEITDFKQFDDFGNNVKFPRFTVQKADTQVRLTDGQTLVIGGLVKRLKKTQVDKVPILGDIPIIGLLFTNRADTDDPHQDLLIFMTVKLVEETEKAPTTVAQSVSQ